MNATRRAQRVRDSFSALAAIMILAGCEEHEFHPPEREAQVAAATTRYHFASFDTIQWPDSATRFNVGNEIWTTHCRKCHGPTGEAGTDYAASRQLDVPSLVSEDWPYDSIDDVRRRVFAGHPEGMPTFGVGKLTPREIDAVAVYLIDGLRPD